MRSPKYQCLYAAVLFTLFAAAAYASSPFTFTPKAVKQGGTLVVTAEDISENNTTLIFLGKSIPFYRYDKGIRTIAGVNPSTPTGVHEATVISTDESGDTHTYIYNVAVKPVNFPHEKLLFEPKKQSKLFREKIITDQDEIAKIFRQWTPEQLWSGKFIKPIKGRTTSAFGTYRLYNNKKLGDHRGLDIGGNPVGAPIKASNSGIVAFARLLPTLGSTIIIDHGQGIHSVYMHMSKTLVSVGQRIEKGQVIGKVGSTGLSTGPHLHWGISIHDTRVSPLEWASRIILD